MAKVTLNDIAGSYASVAALNALFDIIAAGFENTLSLDGTLPNSMGADIDLNSNDLLNVRSIEAQFFKDENGVLVAFANYTGTVASQTFSGNNATLTFTVTVTPVASSNMSVYINGVYQQKATYSLDGQSLTFTEAPPLGTDNIEIVVISSLPIGSTTADLVGYTPTGSGAVPTTVEAKLRESVSVTDFGAVGDTSNDFSGQIANYNPGTDCTAAFRAAIAAVAGAGTVHVPAGNYTITDTLTIPASTGFVCDKGAIIHYFDTTTPGSYLFEIGVGGAAFDGSGVYTKNLYIYLRSGTANGIHIGNSRSSTFEDTYMEGWIPPAPYTGIESRTSLGLRLEPDGGGYCWFNTFRGLHISHVHLGVYALEGINGGISTQNAFYDLRLFGDSLYGDTQATGMAITGCQDSYVYGGYIEAYPDTVSGFPAGINIIGPQAVRWMFRDIVFDYIGGFPMRAVRLATDGSGYPSDIKFENCLFAGTTYPEASGNCFLQDDSPIANRNFVEGVVYDYTAVVTLGISGTCTLNSGEGGDLCHYVLNGRMCTVYGSLSVDSVSSPLGTIYVALPFTCLNADSNNTAAALAVSGFTSGMVSNAVGGAVRASALLSVNGFASGSQVVAGAWLQAGSTINFSATYPMA